MAKSKAQAAGPMMDDQDDWQTRDDVNTLMRADEVHADPKRHKRAITRLSGTLSRVTGKKTGRGGGRSR